MASDQEHIRVHYQAEPEKAKKNETQHETHVTSLAGLRRSIQFYSGLPRKSHFTTNVHQPDTDEPEVLIKETITSHRHLRLRLKEIEKANISNDQIILFFVGTPDKNGRSWHADSNVTERAVNFLLKKLLIGGFFLKVHVGVRDEWLEPDNPFKIDPKIQLTNIPTLWVWDSFKRIVGKNCFDLESVYLLLKD